MKGVMILTAGLILASFFAAHGQNGGNAGTSAVIPEPDFDNCVVYYDATNNKVVSLEITRSETELKGNGLYSLPIAGGGTKTNLVLKGGSSPVTVPRGAEFIVKLASEGVDPSGWVMLYRLEQKIKKNPSKSFRFMTTSKMSGFGVSVFSNYSTKSVSGESQQVLQFQKAKPGVYRIQTAAPLSAGEYFFTIIDPNAEQSTSPMVYAFGVR